MARFTKTTIWERAEERQRERDRWAAEEEAAELDAAQCGYAPGATDTPTLRDYRSERAVERLRRRFPRNGKREWHSYLGDEAVDWFTASDAVWQHRAFETA